MIFATHKTLHLYDPLPIRPSAGLKDEYPAAAPPAMGLTTPTAPRGFGGSAIGEVPSAKPAYTNEKLQKNIERQQAAMGIRRIITPNSVVRSLRAAARDLAPAAGQSFDQDSVPSPVGGKTTTLLSQPTGASRIAAEGALVPPEDFSGGANGSGFRATHRKDLGEPLPAAPVTEEVGRAIYSMEETARLWREQGFTDSAPSVDFSQKMLVAVFGRATIESMATTTNRIVVNYRLQDSAPQQRWRVIPRRDLPVVFQPVPAVSEVPQVPARRTFSPPAP